MSEAQGSAQGTAPATQTTQQQQPATENHRGRIIDANRPKVSEEFNRVEEKLNPKPADKNAQRPGETDAQYQKRMFKVKIEGKEAEVDEEELIRSYQVRKVSEKKAREGEMSRKQAEQLIAMLKDPSQFWKVASDPRIGHDARKLAEEFLAGKLQEELMDPKERELLEVKSKLKEYEDLKKKQEEEIELKKTEALKKRWTENYTQDIVKALDVSGLPRKPETVKRIANKMYLALKIGQTITAEEATTLVKEDLVEESKSIYSATPAETLASLLGEENLKKLREWDISRLKSPPPAPKVEGAREIEPRNKKSMTPLEFRRFNRGR